ncbi:hypothetical protein [Streptomyces sp. NBC_00996]|uniref:hypothetical protein n=1 Tax=Streptomyces sp. NBC_00996 TaxID=2903710 RepID=UPI003868E381|nr:hypothetical protein OG390_04370 [Streptomyces sp. NBC_00996]
MTSGNPFFVAEVVAAGGTGDVPPTVVDAVLARLRGLDHGTRDALEQLAVVPSAAELPLVNVLLGSSQGDPKSRHGMILVNQSAARRGRARLPAPSRGDRTGDLA